MKNIQEIYGNFLRNNFYIIGRPGTGKSFLLNDFTLFLLKKNKNVVSIIVDEKLLEKLADNYHLEDQNNYLFFLGNEKNFSNHYLSHSLSVSNLFFNTLYAERLLKKCLSSEKKQEIIQNLQKEKIDVDFFLQKNYYHQFLEENYLEYIFKWIQKGWLTNIGDIQCFKENKIYQMFIIDFNNNILFYPNAKENEYLYEFMTFLSYILGHNHQDNYFVFDEYLDKHIEIYQKNNYKITTRQQEEKDDLKDYQKIMIIHKNQKNIIYYQDEEYLYQLEEIFKNNSKINWMFLLKHIYKEQYKNLKRELNDEKNHKMQQIIKI